MGKLKQSRLRRFSRLTSKKSVERTLEELFQRMSGGEGLSKLCQAWDVPYGRVLTWLMADVKRYEVYLRALEVGAHLEVQEAKEIADEVALEPDPERREVLRGAAKLRVETRFRRAKAHAPKLYGDNAREGGGQMKVVLVNFTQDEGGRVIEVESEQERVAVKENDTIQGE